ncbi:MAG: putative beta-lysine N-acetyltransferase [Bradymonadales bacterium]|nr:putative beta-lysine N-acetyltransferase [Bradymonadales bacterium]
MKPDQITHIHDSVIQHGKLNNRVYLMHLGDREVPRVIESIEQLADRHGYEKLFCKVPLSSWQRFRQRGFRMEALVPPTMMNEGGLAFASRFLTKPRSEFRQRAQIEQIRRIALEKAAERFHPRLPAGYRFEKADLQHADEIAQLYRSVFETYPFPIQDREYIVRCMRANVRYYAIRQGSILVGVSSAEMELERGWYVEMTDFAVHPDHRGRKLASYLLSRMDREMGNERFKIAYTICRSTSTGMNVTFARGGYRYAGTLVNNTNISGRIESMNVWHKFLRRR